MTKFAPFDAADYLTDEETIAEYLSAALEDPDPDLFLVAVRDVARARGMTQLARATGLGRESLYKALTPGAKPRYDTVLKIMRALGVKLTALPNPPADTAARPEATHAG
jgi:probable addiction module antidote protein